MLASGSPLSRLSPSAFPSALASRAARVSSSTCKNSPPSPSRSHAAPPSSASRHTTPVRPRHAAGAGPWRGGPSGSRRLPDQHRAAHRRDFTAPDVTLALAHRGPQRRAAPPPDRDQRRRIAMLRTTYREPPGHELPQLPPHGTFSHPQPLRTTPLTCCPDPGSTQTHIAA